MKQFTHLLLTRFNTYVNFASPEKRLQSNWLKSRLAFFEQYCLPSIAAQKDAEFRWLVFCDAASPEWFKTKMSTYKPLVQSIYVDGPATDDVIAEKVRETEFVSAPYLITTRLDNDDALSTDHLFSVQNAFQQQAREFVTFPFGLQSFRGHLYNIYWPSNPFLSLIEKVGHDGKVTTVFCVRHDRMGNDNKLKQLLRRPQWLQLLHDSNLGNTLRGWPRLNSHAHPNFNVIWPDRSGTDSIGSRARLSVGAYLARADRLMKKLWLFRRAPTY
jgi:hypothetical protein